MGIQPLQPPLIFYEVAQLHLQSYCFEEEVALAGVELFSTEGAGRCALDLISTIFTPARILELLNETLKFTILPLVQHDLPESEVDGEPQLLILSLQGIQGQPVYLLLVLNLVFKVPRDRVQDVVDGIGDVIPGHFVDQVKHTPVVHLHLFVLAQLGAKDDDVLLRFEPEVDFTAELLLQLDALLKLVNGPLWVFPHVPLGFVEGVLDHDLGVVLGVLSAVGAPAVVLVVVGPLVLVLITTVGHFGLPSNQESKIINII